MWRQLCQPLSTLTLRGGLPKTIHRRFSFGFPKEYKQTVSKNFRDPFHVVRQHWELTPLLACLLVDAYLMCGAVYNTLKNKKTVTELLSDKYIERRVRPSGADPLLVCGAQPDDAIVMYTSLRDMLCPRIYDYAFQKVDIQLTQHNWNSISRNMDLRNPTVHKLVVFNQQYEPWHEMQDVLDKMAEKEAKPCARLKK